MSTNRDYPCWGMLHDTSRLTSQVCRISSSYYHPPTHSPTTLMSSDINRFVSDNCLKVRVYENNLYFSILIVVQVLWSRREKYHRFCYRLRFVSLYHRLPHLIICYQPRPQSRPRLSLPPSPHPVSQTPLTHMHSSPSSFNARLGNRNTSKRRPQMKALANKPNERLVN